MNSAFCTAITCMDGRIQLPAIHWLQNYFDVAYVDVITEAGPIRILSQQSEDRLIRSILKRLKISMDIHSSRGIAVIGHYDCAGNPVAKEKQIRQIRESIDFLKEHYPESEIIGLWVNEKWMVNLIGQNYEKNTNS